MDCLGLVAKPRIEPNKNHLLKNLEGSIFATVRPNRTLFSEKKLQKTEPFQSCLEAKDSLY